MADPLIDLANLAAVKTYLTAAGLAQPDDAVLERLVTAVSQQIQSHLNRRLVRQSYTQTFNGHGRNALYPPQFPIQAVSSVTVNGRVVSAANGPTGAGYVFSEQAIYLRGGAFDRGIQNVVIAYEAGYNPLPADLVQALHGAIGALTSDEFSVTGQGIPKGVSSYSAGDHSISFGGGAAAAGSSASGDAMLLPLDGTTIAQLAPYRRVHAVDLGR
jgi:hypothetical protein